MQIDFEKKLNFFTDIRNFSVDSGQWIVVWKMPEFRDSNEDRSYRSYRSYRYAAQHPLSAARLRLFLEGTDSFPEMQVFDIFQFLFQNF